MKVFYDSDADLNLVKEKKYVLLVMEVRVMHML